MDYYELSVTGRGSPNASLAPTINNKLKYIAVKMSQLNIYHRNSPK